MRLAVLFILGSALAGQTYDEKTQHAIAIVKKAHGRIEIDVKAPGQPVIGVDL